MILTHPTNLGYLPKRIISVVPSQTELLSDLGLGSKTVGISKFCIHPSIWYNTKQRVGGTKTIDMAAVGQLNPDLIIANKEENTREQIEQLAQSCPVWVTDVSNLEQALQMIEDIGLLTGKSEKASSISKRIMAQFGQLTKVAAPVNVSYLIWRKPYMTVGAGTFIHDMLQRCGFSNNFAEKTRYPQIDISDLQKNQAARQFILLSSEPYPFNQKHLDDLKALVPAAKIFLVDGEMFSWYGSRLLQSASYFNRLIAEIEA